MNKFELTLGIILGCLLAAIFFFTASMLNSMLGGVQ